MLWSSSQSGNQRQWGLCEYIIAHTILGGCPVILLISLGGKPKWLPLKFGYHGVMRTSPIVRVGFCRCEQPLYCFVPAQGKPQNRPTTSCRVPPCSNHPVQMLHSLIWQLEFRILDRFTNKSERLTTSTTLAFQKKYLRQDPLIWVFGHFLNFLRHGIENVERHLVWKLHRKIQRKSWSNVLPKLLACIGFLYKVVHKIGRLRKFNRSREIEFNFLTAWTISMNGTLV